MIAVSSSLPGARDRLPVIAAWTILLTLDGYHFTPSKNAFSRDLLHDFDVLIIVNAAAGALLLIADHYSSGSAARGLAAALGVGMRNSWTSDAAHGEPGYGRYNIAFSLAVGTSLRSVLRQVKIWRLVWL